MLLSLENNVLKNLNNQIILSFPELGLYNLTLFSLIIFRTELIDGKTTSSARCKMQVGSQESGRFPEEAMTITPGFLFGESAWTEHMTRTT